MQWDTRQWACGGLALLFILATRAASAEPPASVAFDGQNGKRIFTRDMYWFAPESETPMSPAAVQQHFEAGDFTPIGNNWAELGILQTTMWVAGTLRNDTPEHELILEFRNPRMSRITLFTPNGDGTYAEDAAGVLVPYRERSIKHPMPAFPIRIAPGETKTVLLRLENVGDFRFRAWLWSRADFTNHAAAAYYEDFVTIGVLLVLAVFQFLVFLSLRDRTYLYLSLFVTSWLLFFMAGDGTGYALLWSEMPWLSARANSVFLISMAATFALFTVSYLETRKYARRLYFLTILFVLLCVAHMTFCLLTDTVVRFAINRILGLGTVGLAALLALGALKDRRRLAIFFLGSWCLVLIGSSLMVLLSWYVVSARWVMGTPLINIMFLLSILMWSFELTGRVKVRERDQRRKLEEEVRERTHELRQAISEVKTLSGLLPICSSCKNIRDDSGYWNSVETYLAHHTEADFTHGLCPECYQTLYPEYARKRPHRDTPQPKRTGRPEQA